MDENILKICEQTTCELPHQLFHKFTVAFTVHFALSLIHNFYFLKQSEMRHTIAVSLAHFYIFRLFLDCWIVYL